MTDDQLLLDFLSGQDEFAFELLVRRYGPMVFRVCREILGDRDDAHDAFQATFLVLLRRGDAIRDRASLGRWLYEVASRISRRERRRLFKIRALERQTVVMDLAAPKDDDLADREMKPILHDEIHRLPAKLRDPIVLCYFEGLTVEEVAHRLGCPVPTLKSRLQKGREILRSRLTRRGLAASALLLLMFSLTEEVTAAVPEPLVEATLKVGVEGAAVSKRVASMILEEESKSSSLSLAVGLSALLILIVVLSGARIASARKFQPPIVAPVAASEGFEDSAAARPGLEGSPRLRGFGRDVPGDHCRLR